MEENKKIKTLPLALWGCAILFVLIIAELLTILFFNHGQLVYTLDDPYIHMALAENIAHGHYGINIEEFSSPSSSMVWPLLLALLGFMKLGVWLPFVINIGCSFLTVITFSFIIKASLIGDETRDAMWRSRILLVLLIPATNLVGLVFTGMEHSMQLLLSVTILWGLILEMKTFKVPIWLWLIIVVSPWIRYENAAISGAALLYLLYRRYFGRVLFFGGLSVVGLLLFSVFLKNIGLDFLPASIHVKSDIVNSSGAVSRILGNLRTSLGESRGMQLAVLISLFTAIGLNPIREARERIFAFCLVFAALLHLLIGQFGWYSRYEPYIWSFSLLGGLFLFRVRFNDWASQVGALRLFLTGTTFVILCTSAYVWTLVSTPYASHGIFSQQYQMHRFVTEFYKKPIAVNDLGYVAYGNSEYVLDLWGLACSSAFEMRKGNDPDWMNNMVRSNDVDLVMIYDSWFPERPDKWTCLGSLKMRCKRITTSYDSVQFYAVNKENVKSLTTVLEQFVSTLPESASFEWAIDSSL